MIHTEECSLGSAILLLLVITLVEFKISDFTRFLGGEVHAVSAYVVTLFFQCGLLFHLPLKVFFNFFFFRFNLHTISSLYLIAQFNDFSMFTDLYNHHHNIVLEHCYYLKIKTYLITVIPIPTFSPTND